MQETDLIQGALDGDAEAISALYQMNKDKVFKFVLYRVGSQADAEDLFQEIMLAAFDSLPRFRGEVPFLHWCYQIARNKIKMFWRSKAGKRTLELDETRLGQEMEIETDDEIFKDEELAVEQEMTKQKILKVLDELPDRYAEILKLRFLESHTIKEAAEVMKVTVSNAKVLQHRALKKAAILYSKLH